MAVIQATPLIAGHASGPVLRLTGPISFWGGVDPASGRIVDPSQQACGSTVSGCVLVLPATRGSSSSSAIMLELMRNRLAPAALIMDRVDAILALGVIVSGEMGYGIIPVVRLPAERHDQLIDGTIATIEADGRIDLGNGTGHLSLLRPKEQAKRITGHKR